VFRRKNLLSPRQMYRNRTSVQPLIMAYFTYCSRPFLKEKWARTESTKNDDNGYFFFGPLPSLCSTEQRLGDHKVQDNGEVEM
jgi:hypothetical protein